ncbi:MAG: AAA family ATPase [Saprospiraceae bacterium]
MGNLIQHLHIKNYKSVRDLTLECDRINVFIGKPNAGKSNVLEAISLLGVNFLKPGYEGKFLNSVVRYKSLVHLFSNFNARIPIEVIANHETVVQIVAEKNSDVNSDFTFSITSDGLTRLNIAALEVNIASNGDYKAAGTRDPNPKISPVKKYEFRGIIEKNSNGLSLLAPHGDNFYSVAESTPKLREEIQEFLKPNGLEFLLDVENQRMAVVQKTEDTLLSFPLHLVPGTFQRYIFHMAAIMSNSDSVLLFEEPESHSYAPYVYQLAQHILNDEGGNQYFITTHSPYFLLPLLQEGKDVAVFATWFEDYQTHARRLSEEEIREMLDYGVDIFLNLDHLSAA